MIRLPAMVRPLILALVFVLCAARAHAQSNLGPPPIPATLSPQEAQQVLDVLRDDAKRAQVLTVLENLAKAVPPPAQHAAAAQPAAATVTPPVPTAPAPATTSPAPTAAPAPAPTSPGPTAVPAAAPPASASAPSPPAAAVAANMPIPLAPDSLGAEILVGVSNRLSRLSQQLADTARVLTNFPLIERWIVHLVRSRTARAEMLEASWKLAVVMAIAVGVERLALRPLHRPVAALAARAPLAPRGKTGADDPAQPLARRHGAARLRHTLPLPLRRLPFVLGRFALELLPILLVAAVGYGLLGTPLGEPSTTRFVVLAVLNAYLLTRAVVTVMRVILAPHIPQLRLVHLSDASAEYLLRWGRRMAIIAIFGYAATEVGLLFGLYRVAHDALLKLDVLALHLCLVIVVLQTRRRIAEVIRPRPDAAGPMALLRNRLAGVWHIIAIFYLLALWLVWALDVPNGAAQLVRIFVSTVIVLVLARLAVVSASGMLERAFRITPDLAARYPGLEVRVHRYHPVARAVMRGLITAVAAVVLFQAWGLDSFSWFAADALGSRLVSALISIGMTSVGALLAWEMANAAMQRYLARLSRDAQAARSARLRTLLPMFRTALLISICLIAGLIMLSEIGVNIAPLLAGAGVVGLAIGFGSQKLVQDIITGLFLLLENAMQVGDVVSLGGLSGTVENLSIRTIRLRALDGSVHIVPFSAVTTVTNMTRDFGYAVLDISVGLNEDPDHVTEVVRDVARGLRTEPRWAGAIRDDLEVLGLEKFIDLAYVLRVRIQTVPGQRWAVGRELNRRIKVRFDELAIESPITSHRVLSTVPPPPVAVRKPLEEDTAAPIA